MFRVIYPALVLLGQTTTEFESTQSALEGTSGYAVGWGTLMLLNAGLAQSKNRSGLAWFFVSLFLGPIATFFIVVTDKVPPSGPSG